MKNKSYIVGCLILALTSLGWGVTCANNWCGPYTVPMYNCLSGTNTNSATTGCLNSGYLQVGFSSITTSGSHGNPFGTISAAGIQAEYGSNAAGPDVVPNGSVGLKQYMIFANNNVQAYDKTTHKPIWVDNSGNPAPQTATDPWAATAPGDPTLGPGYCNQETADFNVSYDHVNSEWIFVGTTAINSGSLNLGHRDLCIASSGDDLYNGGTSYWSSYAFDLTGSSVSPAIFLPYSMVSGNKVYDLADYPRFGTWKDGYYLTFDFINQGTSTPGQIDGFAVCKLDQTDIVAGYAASGATCYAYIPTSAPPMVHTLLPADAESSSFPTSAAGEFFLATVNPGTDGNPCTRTSPPYCTSNQLAFWTWGEIVAEDASTSISVNTFTPGCYHPTLGQTGDTVCIQQPGTSNILDSVGDRLMSPLAYRYLQLPDCAPACPDGEYLAVTQTIQLDNTGSSNLTGIRYYTISSPSSTPAVTYQGNFSDSTNYYAMGSNAIDKAGDVGYTFTLSSPETDTTYPSIYADRLDRLGNPGTATVVQSGTNTIVDNCNHHWGEYVSASIDPSDDLTFWAAGEYLSSNGINEDNCHGAESGCTSSVTYGCNWQTGVFTCQKGSGFCL